MNKAELMEYGIKAEKIRAFQEEYWADVKKQAARMVKEEKERDADPSPASIREAIASMLCLIPDPARLNKILYNVNRHYAEYRNEQYQAQEKTLKQPETVQKGATEAAAPLARAERHFNFPSAVETVPATAKDTPEMAQEGACECP